MDYQLFSPFLSLMFQALTLNSKLVSHDKWELSHKTINELSRICLCYQELIVKQDRQISIFLLE